MKTLFFISAAGVCGILCRYGIGNITARFFSGAFPAATFIINLAGAFLIGFAYVFGVEKAALSPEIRLGLMVGFLGGFTTFSSFSLETVRLLETGYYGQAAFYSIGSNLIGFGLTFLGIVIARMLAE